MPQNTKPQWNAPLPQLVCSTTQPGSARNWAWHKRAATLQNLHQRPLWNCGPVWAQVKNAVRVVGQNRMLYSLRHTDATRGLIAGTDIHTLVRQMGTSISMLERHYGKLVPTLKAAQLA